MGLTVNPEAKAKVPTSSAGNSVRITGAEILTPDSCLLTPDAILTPDSRLLTPISQRDIEAKPRRGLTLIELMVVMAIISVIIAVTLPATTNGLSSVRLKGAASNVATFINSALNRAERREQVMEIFVLPKENKLVLDSSEPGYTKTLALPEGVAIAGEAPVRILLMPGAAPPRVSIDLFNDRGAHRTVQLDPVTGVPEVTPQ